VDDSPRHFLAELSARVRRSLRDSTRRVVLAAEDVRNLAHMVKPEADGGWGLDAVWSDDFHHQMRRCLAGDRDGYFEDFQGTAEEIAATARQGWFYCGQYAPFFGAPRGTDPRGIDPRRFVFFIQNHDQVGNRAFGDRLHRSGERGIDWASYRAASALLLLLPQTPLLFMGQEWAASSPFQYFTDHAPALGAKVTQGRRNEFSRFAAFSDPQTRALIPDPQDTETFEHSRLRWDEIAAEPHEATLKFYQALLALRRQEAALHANTPLHFAVEAPDADALLLRRESSADQPLLLVVRLRGSGAVDFSSPAAAVPGRDRNWRLLLSSEEESFAHDAAPPRLELGVGRIVFSRPGAVILKAESSTSQGGQ
jgi:maltooligosyltrehalose trehalohydrolase